MISDRQKGATPEIVHVTPGNDQPQTILDILLNKDNAYITMLVEKVYKLMREDLSRLRRMS